MPVIALHACSSERGQGKGDQGHKDEPAGDGAKKKNEAGGGAKSSSDKETGDHGGDSKEGDKDDKKGSSAEDAKKGDKGAGGDAKDEPELPVPWASGGTAAMKNKSDYPNPFTSDPSTCVIVATTTQGPCTTKNDLERVDISEGWRGLPLRLALKVVDKSCKPLSGVVVKVWHTNVEGSYSGQTPQNRFCLKKREYSKVNFFRGIQMSDSKGEAFFDTCFPGWYPDRAIHIHFQVKHKDRSYRISQLFFPDDVVAKIFAQHPDYRPFGPPDANNKTDDIYNRMSAEAKKRLLLDVQRLPDGAMLASKVITVV